MRPAKRSVFIQVRVTEQERRDLEKIAEHRGQTQSGVVRGWIHQAAARLKK